MIRDNEKLSWEKNNQFKKFENLEDIHSKMENKYTRFLSIIIYIYLILFINCIYFKY